MSTIYLIESGSYSDYSVDRAFSTEAKAQEYIDRWVAHKEEYGGYMGDKPDILEMDIDEELPRTIHYIHVKMAKDGTTETVLNRDFCTPDKYSPLGFRMYDFRTKELVWNVETTDKERAVKVVNEKRTQIIAADIWGDQRATGKYFERTH